MLAFMPTEVLAKDIQIKVVIQNGWLEVREAKQPQKVTISL